ncbi:MAG: FAD-binding oxidoreductase [Lentisphaeraceae bacterium]|nr:FAD-binding oxidoreductase [Lentisphaeraceae bacterium]
MVSISYEGQDFEVQSDESVLDVLLKNGKEIPNSCKSGICQSCLMVCTSGSPTEESQKGIKDSRQKAGYFKSCVCIPEGPMTVSLSELELQYSSSIIAKELLNERTLLIRLAKPEGFEYESGQFINLIRPSDSLTRSYSLASIPEEDFLELHIRYYEDGKMSSWLKEIAQSGESVEFSGPIGDCYYTPGKEDQDLLLAGIGTGMAPLYGIARDAVNRGHSGKITIIQGAMNAAGLYYTDEFAKVADSAENISFIASTVDGSMGREGKIDDVVKANFPSLKDFRVFLCGSPNTVNRLKRYSFLAGANMGDIYSDPFTPAAG